jgi:xanthine dehydrogenase YagR molybdenum-binding subunit
MPDYKWPEFENRTLIGKRISRVDGPAKTTGTAKYTFDVKRPGMLYGAILICPHARAKVTKIDAAKARQMPGVKAVRLVQEVGAEVKWSHDEIAYVAAETEDEARDAARAVEVEYEVLAHFVDEEQKDQAPDAQPAQAQTTGDPDSAFSSAEVVSEGYYGLSSIAHCCMEPHGQVCEWEDAENMTAWCSTQGVSSLPGQFAEAFGVTASNIRVVTPYMGGGFGSKFGIDRWGVQCGELARETKAPVKLMLDRNLEIAVAGGRPSTYANVKVACRKDGTMTGWESESWGTGGPAGSGSPPIPYVFQVPNRRHQHTSVPTNIGPSRAWRAPNHPQACLVTMAALEDAAAALNMDPLEFFFQNIRLTGRLAPVYKQELEIAARMIEWEENWNPRGEGGSHPIRRGLGLSLHTWGGRGHGSNCELVIYPDGMIEAKLGSQDLGTGTRTVIAIVVADTFKVPLSAVKVSIGDSRYPQSGPSGGSTTVGGVSSATRRAAENALEAFYEKLAAALEVPADELSLEDGRLLYPSGSLTWKEATARIGVNSITATGSNPGPGNLIDSGVGGVQMADVSVDMETGIVRINKMVAVQDCGLIIDLKTAESQVYGGLIMGIAYALAEEKVFDPITGRLLNPDMEFYQLPGILDIGELDIHMMTGPGYDERGVIGLGEPPVISPGAAISNAVANAIGVRVPSLPLTADRVLEALEKGGVRG